MLDTRRQITRNRITYSCQNCRRRKIKCTKAHPSCGQCVKTNENCVYDTSDGPSIPKEDPTESYSHRKRKSVTPHAFNDGKDESLTPSTPHSNGLDPILSKFDTVVARLLSSTTHGQRDHNGSLSTSDWALLEGKKANLTDLGKISDKLNLLLNSLKSEVQRESETISVASEAPNQLQVNPVVIVDNAEPEGLSRQNLNLQYSFIPSQQQSNVLFRKWLFSVYPLMPLIHPSEALIKYEAFHQWYKHGYDKGYPNPVKAFMPMIFAIHYGGIVSLSVRGVRRWWPGTPRRMLLVITWDQYKQSIRSSGPLTRPTLAAKVMMSHLCRGDAENVQMGASVTAIIRNAQVLGVHRQPSRDSSVSDAECDRRLWWEIVNLDVALASSSNLPPLTNEHYFDTTLPSEIKDIMSGTAEAARYEHDLRLGLVAADSADDPQVTACTSMVSVYYLVCRARAYLTMSTRKLIDISLKTKAITKEDMTQMRQILSSLELELRAAIDRIPSIGMPEMAFVPSSSPEQMTIMDHGNLYGEKLTLTEVIVMLGDEPVKEPHTLPHVQQSKYTTIAFHKWARIYLSAMLDQIYSLSYGPFMRNSKSKMWLVARQCLLKHCHSFLRKYIALAMDPEIQCFQWTWTTLLQPMHSSLLLLLDLYERPDSPEAARSRALIDHMLSLALVGQEIVGGDNGITSTHPLDECGQEAKSLLMDLRTKAWQRAGLDPTVLWTEHDQIDVGVAQSPTNADLLARSMREDTIHETRTGLSTSVQGALPSRRRGNSPIVPGQIRHPSEVGVPPVVEGSLLCPLRDNQATPPPNVSRLVRAPRDQEPAPLHRHEQWLRVPEGHVASMNDINQLLQRIKDAKLSASQASETVRTHGGTDNGKGLDAGHGRNIKIQRRINDQDEVLQMALEEVGEQNGGHQSETTSVAKESRDPVLPRMEHSTSATIKGSSQAHIQLPLDGGLDADFNFEFDWAHWDSVFMPLHDESFADLMDMGDGHDGQRDATE